MTNDGEAKLIVLRVFRMVSGVTSSPFLLNGRIRHYLNKYVEQEKKFVEQFLEDLYVDDTTSNVSTVEKGKRFYEREKETFCLVQGSI